MGVLIPRHLPLTLSYSTCCPLAHTTLWPTSRAWVIGDEDHSPHQVSCVFWATITPRAQSGELIGRDKGRWCAENAKGPTGQGLARAPLFNAGGQFLRPDQRGLRGFAGHRLSLEIAAKLNKTCGVMDSCPPSQNPLSPSTT